MARRSSFWLSPAGIVLGYLLTLFAATAGVVAFPFSTVFLSMLFFVVGVFFVVAIPVVVLAYLLMIIAILRGFVSISRRLAFGSDQKTGWQWRMQFASLKNGAEPPRTDDVLWDWWIDGSP
jgi:hypothetical protein